MIKSIVNTIGALVLTIILIASPIIAFIGIKENWEDLRAFPCGLGIVITVLEFIFLFAGIKGYVEGGEDESKNINQDT
jgi:hypothetical protein